MHFEQKFQNKKFNFFPLNLLHIRNYRFEIILETVISKTKLTIKFVTLPNTCDKTSRLAYAFLLLYSVTVGNFIRKIKYKHAKKFGNFLWEKFLPPCFSVRTTFIIKKSLSCSIFGAYF